jgi:hypothetical protein
MTSSLSFASKVSRLCVTAATVDFNNEFLHGCEREGFEVTFVPYNYDEHRYVHELNVVKQELGVSESYALIGMST